MGGFYGSIHLRTGDVAAVRGALEQLSGESGTRFLVAPPLDGWITVFPNANGQDLGVSETLAGILGCPLLHCLVHDDDVFCYRFHEGGVLVDAYDSCPQYFGCDAAPRGGDVERWRSLLPDAARRAELKRLLESEPAGSEAERMAEFAALLGLPNAGSAYEYLQDGERDGIREWKRFVHVPDLAAERAAKRSATAKAKVEMKQLAGTGLLVLEIAGKKASGGPFPAGPVWCIDPITSEVMLAWTGSPVESAVPTRLVRVDVRTGLSTDTGVEVSSHANCMAASPTMPWVAVGCACGDWKTEVWNRNDGTLLAEIPQSRAVEQVCFGPDGRTLFSLSESNVTVVDLSAPGSDRAIPLGQAGRRMALHPSGSHLVVECGGMLAVVPLATGTLANTVWIPEPPGPRRDLLEQVAAAGKERQIFASLEGHVPKEELESHRLRMARHFLPKQAVFSLGFGPSGNLLFCGTTAGLCVLEWAKLLAAPDAGPVEPMAFVRAERLPGDEDGMSGQQLIYAVPVDGAGKRVLFAGLEGKAKFVNLADGRIGDLVSPPVRRPFWQLELTPDRTALVATAVPPREGRGMPKPSSFQVWNYRALCEAAGLAW